MPVPNPFHKLNMIALRQRINRAEISTDINKTEQLRQRAAADLWHERDNINRQSNMLCQAESGINQLITSPKQGVDLIKNMIRILADLPENHWNSEQALQQRNQMQQQVGVLASSLVGARKNLLNLKKIMFDEDKDIHYLISQDFEIEHVEKEMKRKLDSIQRKTNGGVKAKLPAEKSIEAGLLAREAKMWDDRLKSTIQRVEKEINNIEYLEKKMARRESDLADSLKSPSGMRDSLQTMNQLLHDYEKMEKTFMDENVMLASIKTVIDKKRELSERIRILLDEQKMDPSAAANP